MGRTIALQIDNLLLQFPGSFFNVAGYPPRFRPPADNGIDLGGHKIEWMIFFFMGFPASGPFQRYHNRR